MSDCSGSQPASKLESATQGAASAAHSQADSPKPSPGAVKLYALFAAPRGVYALDLRRLEHKVASPLNRDAIKQELGGGLDTAELFLIGSSGLLFPPTVQRSVDDEPNIYFSISQNLDVAARKALIYSFDTVHSAVESFSHTSPDDPRDRAQRIGWAAALKSLPFVRVEPLKQEAPPRAASSSETAIELELSYAKRTGPLDSDVSLGLDINYQLRVAVDLLNESITVAFETQCVSICQKYPRCPHNPEPLP